MDPSQPQGSDDPEARLLELEHCVKFGKPLPPAMRDWMLDALSRRRADGVSLDEALGLPKGAHARRQARDSWLRLALTRLDPNQELTTRAAAAELSKALKRYRPNAILGPPSDKWGPIQKAVWFAHHSGCELPGADQLRNIITEWRRKPG